MLGKSVKIDTGGGSINADKSSIGFDNIISINE